MTTPARLAAIGELLEAANHRHAGVLSSRPACAACMKARGARKQLELAADALAASACELGAALGGLLPLDGKGRCFRCNFQEPDEHLMHIDRDNLWDGDQPCLDHETYADARKALATIPDPEEE